MMVSVGHFHAFGDSQLATTSLTYSSGIGIADNFVAGSGGGLCISDCPNTLIRNTIFNGNTAFLVSSPSLV